MPAFTFENRDGYLYLHREGVRHSPPEGPPAHWCGVLEVLECATWQPHVPTDEWKRVAVMLLDDQRTVLVWNRKSAGANHYPDHPDHIPSANDYLVIRREELADLIRAERIRLQHADR